MPQAGTEQLREVVYELAKENGRDDAAKILREEAHYLEEVA